ncbi:MAG TPA: amino acid permease, partial [Chryseosolibacter sp.]|nr:amino acid permease [Chryseosolibacter sp.]
LFGLLVFGFFAAKAAVWDMNWQDAWTIRQHASRVGGSDADTWMQLTGVVALGAIASAMVGSIFSSDAWNNVTFIAGEVKNPQRNIGLSLFLGTLIVTVVYVTANLMYLGVLPLDQLAFAKDNRIALSVSTEIFGASGTVILAVLIMISTFGCNNGLILSGARVYYTMANDGLFFKKTGRLNEHAVPEYALWIQCLVACMLCLSGQYGNLLDMVSFVVVLFYVLTIVGIFILRKTRPDAPRPYKAFGYPVLPVIYILMGITFCTLLIRYKPSYTWPGLIITLIGIPIYFLALRQRSSK